MAWLFQPLPLASTFSVTDVDEALDASATEVATAHGSLAVEEQYALTGQASATGQGSVAIVDDEEQLQGQDADVEQGSIAVGTLVVRLRSRKVGGASTADRLLDGIQAQAQAGTTTKVLSVLLGGTGITTAQQSFPTKTRACLLTGQVRTTDVGTVTYVQQGGGGLPAWVQVPTQLDEENYYNTAFGPDSGKESAWIHTLSDKTVDFAATPPDLLRNGHRVHNDTEGDDLWTHYMQYKRTGLPIHLTWAQAWRDFFVDDYAPNMVEIGGSGSDVIFGLSCNNYDHLYGQGLVMWATERNDVAARNAVLSIASTVEQQMYDDLVPGVNSASFNESRRYARRLLFYCYITMIEPTTRWLAARDHMIEAWIQSPGWVDTTHPTTPTIIGGTHACGRSMGNTTGPNLGLGGWINTQFDQGLRHDHSFMYGLKFEAFWLAYKLTGRTDVRDQLIQMARYVLHYAWDPTHVNPMCGARWGHRPLTGTGAAPAGMGSPGFLHDHADEYSPANSGVPINPFPPLWSDPATAPTDNYEASLVNGLIYAYKLTGEVPFLVRAREHFRQATRYADATGHPTKLPENEVRKFIDTEKNSDGDYFDFNKGQLQYCSYIFENGGVPELEPSAGFQPPYRVPTVPGEVVKIAGDLTPTANTVTYTAGDTTGSEWPTNVYGDVYPPEIGTAAFGNQQLMTGDTRTKFIESYGAAGAMVIAGSGGHKGTPIYGAALFDFNDARWKRIWTTQGNPGIDNVTQGNVDIRSGTTTHGCPNLERDVVEYYFGSSPHKTPSNGDWNPDHWVIGGGGSTAAQRAIVPLTANPRDQSWEVSRDYNDSGVVKTGDHAWTANTQGLLPGNRHEGGDFNGLQNGRFPRTGYMTESQFFHPPVAGTLEPTQSEIPAPGHIWDHYYELRTEEGGGPKGSIITGRHQNIGGDGTTSIGWSHRFDLHTGIWHEFSLNSAVGSNAPTGNEPQSQSSALASAEDPVTRRVFMIAKRYFKDSAGRINYMNLADKTWRSFTVGTGGTAGNLNTRTENMWVDPDRRLLLLNGDTTPWLWAFDLQTIDSQTTPSAGLGGWRGIPYDDIPGIQSGAPWAVDSVTFASNVGKHTGAADVHMVWRYCPLNGKYYRVHVRYQGGSFGGQPPADLSYQITVLQRLTPPPIVSGPRANFYYTTEASSGRWTLDEMPLAKGLPVPDASIGYAVCGFSWFHYVPALQCFAYAPLDFAGGRPTIRRCVYLIKPF